MDPNILLIIGGVVLITLTLASVVIVPEQTSIIIQRLGKFQRVATPGFSLKVPLIDTRAGKVNLRVQQLDVSVETKTLDNVFVDLQVSVQYQIISTKIKEAFYSLDDPHAQIASYVFDDVRAEVPKMDLDDVFSKKDDIAVAVARNLSNSMNEYGFVIVKTLITDINPDADVKQSMNRINAARRDKHAALEEGEAEKIKMIKEAEAEAESKRLQGEGVAKQRMEIVRGFKESVEDFQTSLQGVTPEEVMQFVLLTQYFDTIQAIGSNSKNSTVLMPHSPAAMKDFQNQIIQGTIVGGKMTPPSMPTASPE